ncbi:MAG: hypothetical protein ACYCSO_08785 [Cuniculiplasma sp.]|nr:MAG: hypothetical protein AMDU5_GPLC00015G0010 [Thermoplasmatales archaeon Gpl]
MTTNEDTKEVVREKKEQEVESRYTFQNGDISRDRFLEIESIGEKIGQIWQEHDLSILDLKSLLPYLASMIFLEAGDSDFEVLDYIENYMKPAIFEFGRRIRNSKKFKGFGYNPTVTR